jgi:hypothetical protein
MFDFPVFLKYDSNYEYPSSFNLGTDNYDPYIDKVILQVPLDSRGLIDISKNKRTLTNYNSTFSPDRKIVNNGSRWFSGASNFYFSAGDLDDWDLGYDDFTIECWFYLISFASAGIFRHLIGNGDSITGGWRILIHSNANILFNPYTDGGNRNFQTSDKVVQLEKWTHLAVTKYGKRILIFINGKLSSSHNFADNYLVNTSTPLRIGSTDGINWNMHGHISDIRITRGVARYTKNFELPKKANPVNKNPVPIIDPAFGIGKKVNYQGPVFLNNNVVKGGSAFEYPGERSLSSPLKSLIVSTENLRLSRIGTAIKGISILPNLPKRYYSIVNNRMWPTQLAASIPTGWEATAKDGIYIGGTTQTQSYDHGLPQYNNNTTDWTFICRIKPTTTESVSTTLSCTGLGAGTAADYQMFIEAEHSGTNRGLGITLGTNQGHCILHGDATYAAVLKLSGFTITGWAWVVVQANTAGVLKFWLYNSLGQLLGYTDITCTANVISPRYLGSQYKHGIGYVSNIMVFNKAIGIGYNLFKTVLDPMFFFKVQ